MKGDLPSRETVLDDTMLDALTVRRVLLLAASAWVAFHVVLSVAFHQDRQPAAVMAAVILVTVLTVAVALRPLYDPATRRVSPALGSVLAVSCIAVTAATEPFLTAEGLVGWGNWPMRSLGVVIAALVFRHFRPGAVAAVAGMTAVNTVVAVRMHEDHPTVQLNAALLMAVPAVTWLLMAMALRMLLDPSLRTTEDYRRRQLEIDAESVVSRAVQDADEDRRADLRSRVLPLLSRLADEQHAITAADREEAAVMATSLRDDLKARWLLTTAVRREILAARRRSVHVLVSGDTPALHPETDSLVLTTRQVLTRLLPELPPGAQLSCRITSAERTSVFAVRCDDGDCVKRAAEVLRATVTGQDAIRAVVEDGEEELLAEIIVDRVPL